MFLGLAIMDLADCFLEAIFCTFATITNTHENISVWDRYPVATVVVNVHKPWCFQEFQSTPSATAGRGDVASKKAVKSQPCLALAGVSEMEKSLNLKSKHANRCQPECIFLHRKHLEVSYISETF